MKRVIASCLLIPVMALGFIPMSATQAAGVPSAEALRPLDLEVNWTAQVVLNRQRDVIRHVTNDEDNVYVQSSAGVVTVLDAATGRRMWVRQLGRNDEFSFQAVSNANLLLVVSGPVVRAVNKFTGKVIFEFRLRRQPTSAPLVTEDMFYVPQENGSIYAYSIEVLEYLERYGTLPPRVAQKYSWRFISNDRTEYPPVIGNDQICFASDKRNLHSLSLKGRSHFQIFLNARPSAPLSVDTSHAVPHVIVATENDELFSFELDRGARGWNFPVERAVTLEPFIHAGRVYVVMDHTGVTCISSETGRHIQVPVPGNGDRTTRWFVPGIEAVAGVTDEYLYGIDENRRLVAIRHDDATCTATALISDFSIDHTNALTDRLFLVSSDGEVASLKPLGSEFATFHRRPERQPIDVDVQERDEPADGEEATDDNAEE